MAIKTKFALAVLLAWVGLSSVYLYYWQFRDYGWFDAQGVWLQPANSQEFMQKARATLAAAEPAESLLVVHIIDKACGCNPFVSNHIAELAVSNHFTEVTLTVAEAQAFGLRVPATPLIMVLRAEPISLTQTQTEATTTEQNWQLIYAGPYATGPVCAVENSFLPSVLSGELRLVGAWLNGQVKTCRCLVL